MKLVIVSDDFNEVDEIETIDKLANAWYYSPDDETAIYFGLILISGGIVYFIRRYGTTEAFNYFMNACKMSDKYNELLGYIQKSSDINTLNNICQQNYITLEIEDWAGEDPIDQMYYPYSPLYCLEPNIDNNSWVDDAAEQIPLPTYEED